MIRILFVAALLASASPAAVLAAEIPKEGKLDEHIRFVDYNPFQITLVATALFASTQIQFGEDETVIHASIGDPVWEIAPTDNHVFIKVREIHKPTNLQVVTERPDHTTRSYQIVLGAVSPAETAKHPPYFLVRFRYPSDELARKQQAEAAAIAARKAGEVDQILARDEANGPRNYAYAVQGEADFEPSEVYDNGKVTTFTFVGNIEMPAIYATDDGGKEELVPKSVSGNSVFVHMVGKKFVLRRGDAVLCVFNEKFVPGGIDPGTRTTSPSVTRVAAGGVKKPSDISRSAPAEPAGALGRSINSTTGSTGAPSALRR